jgi:hypothetical protein
LQTVRRRPVQQFFSQSDYNFVLVLKKRNDPDY